MLGPWLATPLGAGDHRATVTAPYSPPSTGHPLGGDYLGRDVVARLLHGGALIVLVPLTAVVIAELLGAVTGVVLAWAGRGTRPIRIALDVVLIVPPVVTMLVVLTGVGAAPAALMVLVLVFTVPFVSRYMHAAAQPILGSGFVDAARAAGDSRLTVAVREVLPPLAVTMLADLGVRYVGAVYLVSTAAFLGAGSFTAESNWAAMVQQNSEGISLNMWTVAAPALLIAAITVPANLLADRLLEARR
jgi:peptide/nickel transport system permease protein